MSDPPHDRVISSLRTQVQDLVSQLTQLNAKLVRSYDRISDLEDALHVAATALDHSNHTISRLELEKSQHLSQLTSGSLVEKSHVTAELTRLMERATEEAAQRGQAESAKEKIERELEELSASLFGEANAMVEDARLARSRSERKADDAEGRLREAEEAVRIMQTQMQALIHDPGPSSAVDPAERLIKNHLAYHEYFAFLSHLRSLHTSSPSTIPPAMATLLQLPFLSRLLNEDSEPTLRLDLAPSLNWLSRRSVLSAIHTAQLSVEPISFASLFTLSMQSPFITIAGLSPSVDVDLNIPCALCGTPVFDTNHQPPHITIPSNTTWSAAAGSFFRKRALSTNGSSTSTPSPPPPNNTFNPQSQIYIFRLASLPTASSSALSSFTKTSPSSPPISNSSSRPASSASSSSTTTTTTIPTTYYPLCTSGWCLARLRTTCTLWSFIRTGIVEKVWDEPVILPPTPTATPTPPVPESAAIERASDGGKPPPLPPRRRGLWGIASALGERAASWGEGTSKEKLKAGNAMAELSVATPPPLPKRSLNRSRGGNSNSSSPIAQFPSSIPPPPPSDSTPPLPDGADISLSQAMNVPLPESRVGTPVNGQTIMVAAQTVSRTGSPAVPPPVPRRAAARNKGLSGGEEGGENAKVALDETKTLAEMTIPESESGGGGVEEKDSSKLEEPDAEEVVQDDDEQTTTTTTTAEYVGTLVWEERVWRELVRMRKEMFYARLGGA